jgi:hypothetical protein
MFTICFEGYPTYLQSNSDYLIFKLNLSTFTYELDGPPIPNTPDAPVKQEDLTRVLTQANQIVSGLRGRFRLQAHTSWFYLITVILFSSVLMGYAFLQKELFSLLILNAYVSYMVFMALITMFVEYCVWCNARGVATNLKRMLDSESMQLQDTNNTFEALTHRETPIILGFKLNIKTEEEDED